MKNGLSFARGWDAQRDEDAAVGGGAADFGPAGNSRQYGNYHNEETNLSRPTGILTSESTRPYKAPDGVLFSNDRAKLLRYPVWKKQTAYTVPPSVIEIGDDAFSNCVSLSRVEIPSSVTKIGHFAFSGCTSLTAIMVNKENEQYSATDGVLFSKDGTKLILYPLGKRNSAYAIPPSVIEIGDDAFYDCIDLTKIVIPPSVTEIGHFAFSECTGLISVNIPPSLIEMGDDAFYGCTGLTKVNIPSSVTKIGDDAFSECTNLVGIIVNEENEQYMAVDGVLFNKDRTKLIQYPAGKQDAAYTIPPSVTEIGVRAFYGCTGLDQVNISSSVTEIGGYAFSECTGISNVNISSSVIKIGTGAFYGCTGLTGITVSEENEKYMAIDNVLFSKDKSAILLYPVGKKNAAYTIPPSVTGIVSIAFHGCTNLTEIKVSEENEQYTAIDGVLFSKDETKLMMYPVGKKDSVYTIPPSVTKIGHFAFHGCAGLTHVDIPPSVVNIGNFAFIGCTGLTHVDIPSSVTKIGRSAFSDCNNITNMNIPPSVTIIGRGAFSDCSSLTSVTIPPSVAKIGVSIFYGCTSLTSVRISRRTRFRRDIFPGKVRLYYRD